MSRLSLGVVTLGILMAQAPAGALAQAPAQPFVAHANVSVANNSPVPQTVAGTGVAPFVLLPEQQAQLDMNVAPPPAPVAAGSSVPVRFEYSVGEGAGPQCRGTIDMSLNMAGRPAGTTEVTNCVAHSLGTDGANCQIVVSAKNDVCQGGLAFSAQ